MLKRREYAFHELLPQAKADALSLFAEAEERSDLGGDVFIPLPVREYPLIHFLKVADAENCPAEPDYELR